MTTFISRRELLRRAGLAGATAAIAPAGLLLAADAAAAQAPLANLTSNEAATLTAVVARLIPADATGPGAVEAGAIRYIDRALGGALRASRTAYQAGLKALDDYASSSRGSPFAELTATGQDAVLIDVEAGMATGFAGGSAAFFTLVRAHTLQGTFCDPFYGGNANFAGWDLVGYPGVRTIVTPDEQRLGADVSPNHKSAYDYDMFTKGQP